MATVTQPFNSVESQRRVRHPLQALRGYIRYYVTIEGALTAVIYLAFWFWIGLAIDYGCFKLFAFDWIEELQAASGGRADIYVRTGVLILLVLGLIALVAYKVLFRLMREFSDPALALVLERRFPRELGDRVITAVELADPVKTKGYGFSPELVNKTIQDAAERVEKVPVREVFNWGRLYWLGFWAGLSTVGVYLVVMIVACVVNGLSAAGEPDVRGQQRGPTANPLDFAWRFNDVAGIWAERNLLIQNTYWPRRAYVEVVRFRDTAAHPGEMRVGRDEQRPDVKVRAFRWVVADSAAQGGWRPLLWSDLKNYLDPGLLEKAKVSAEFGGWLFDADDLDNSVADVLPARWQDRPISEVRAELSDPKTLENLQKSAGANGVQAAQSLLDWQQWTVDKIEIQEGKGEVRRQLRDQHPQTHKGLQDVFDRLVELADSSSMSRRLRLLEVPEKVKVFYRGKNTKNSSETEKGGDNKYSIGLADLKESVTFTVRGLDYYTPSKQIILVPPPNLKTLSIEKDEPAYLHYRLQGSQAPLKGRRQSFPQQNISVTGDQSTITVPLGTNLILRAESDRPLQETIRVKAPARTDERGAVLPPKSPVLSRDRTSFSMEFPNISRSIEFELEFSDEDNVKGKRRIIIRPTDDRAPEVLDMELQAILRKPRFRSDQARTGAGTATDGFLITPKALLPFKGVVRDDYALTRGSWLYDLAEVDIELVGESSLPSTGLDKGKDKLPRLVLQGAGQTRRGAMIATGLQFISTLPTANLTSAGYLDFLGRLVQRDLAQGDRPSAAEIRLDLANFKKRLEERAGEEIPAAALDQRLKDKEQWVKGKAGVRGFIKEYNLQDERGFDVAGLKLLPTDPTAPQLHYLLHLGVEVEDNNIESGPNPGRSKSPFTFLVISENELLSQIALEEEVLRDRLEKAYDKVKNGQTLMEDQMQKLSNPSNDLALVAIRVDEVRKAEMDAGITVKEISTDYQRILKELEINNVDVDKVKTVRKNIVNPLEELTHPTFGMLQTTDEAVGKLYQSLEEDQATKKSGDRNQYRLQAQKARDELEALSQRINDILVAMQSGITKAKLQETLILIEREQRGEHARITALHQRVLQDLINELIGPTKKDKK